MRKIAALLAAVPLAAFAQDGTPQPAQAQPQPPPSQPAQAAPAQPQYPPPPQYAPPPPQYAPPPHYAPPPPGAPPPQYPQPPRKQRGTWYIGFGFGSGDGSVKGAGQTLDFEEMVAPDRTTLSFNLRVGATLSPRLLLGFDGGAVGSSAEANGLTSTVQLNYYDLGAMYFPMERGFYLRAGAGLSAVLWEIEPLGRSTARGFNLLGGVGYAFWLGRAFNLTLNLDAQRHFFSENDFEGGTAWSAWVGFDWY